MKNYMLILALMVSAVPALAQDPDEAALRELGMGPFGIYATGNLALNDLKRGDYPVQQLKRFFQEAKLPLSSGQEKQLHGIVDGVVKQLQETGDNKDAVIRINAEYNRKVSSVLNPDQRAELRRYRTEQIMMRGGFQALKLILETAEAPLTSEQAEQVQGLYIELNRQVDQLVKGAKDTPDRAQIDKIQSETLGKVVRILTPPQRRALIASRQGVLSSKLKP